MDKNVDIKERGLGDRLKDRHKCRQKNEGSIKAEAEQRYRDKETDGQAEADRKIGSLISMGRQTDRKIDRKTG